MAQVGSDNPESTQGGAHHRPLEQARAQVIDLLSRQALERDLLSRDSGPRHDVMSQLLARQQQARLAQRLGSFHPADIAFVLESLAPEAREIAWQLVKPAQRGAVLLEMGEAVLRTLLMDMPAESIAAAIRHLESDDIADLLEQLPSELGQSVLAHLDRDDQAEVRSVLSFPEGTVGAMMDLDFITVRDDATLAIPVIGVASSSFALGEPIGIDIVVSLLLEVTALTLVLLRPGRRAAAMPGEPV